MDPKAEELAARREARKRKILENAKNRISRLTGRDGEENGMDTVCVQLTSIRSNQILLEQRMPQMQRVQMMVHRAKGSFTRIQNWNVTSTLSRCHFQWNH